MDEAAPRAPELDVQFIDGRILFSRRHAGGHHGHQGQFVLHLEVCHIETPVQACCTRVVCRNPHEHEQ